MKIMAEQLFINDFGKKNRTHNTYSKEKFNNTMRLFSKGLMVVLVISLGMFNIFSATAEELLVKAYEGEIPSSKLAILDLSNKNGLLLSVNPDDPKFDNVNEEIKSLFNQDKFYPKLQLLPGQHTLILGTGSRNFFKVEFTAEAKHTYRFEVLMNYEIENGVEKVTGLKAYIKDIRTNKIYQGIEIPRQEAVTFFNKKTSKQIPALGDIQLAVSFDSGLRMEQYTPTEFYIDRKIPLGSGETLAALITTYNNKTEAALVIFRVVGVNEKEKSVIVEGKSVFVDGKVKLSDGRILSITNAAYQDIPQLNYALKNLASQDSAEADSPSYLAYNVTEELIKIEMRDSRDSFHVNAGGFYITPKDIIRGNQGHYLTGIGLAKVQQERKISADESGYLVGIDNERGLTLKDKGHSE